MRSWLMALCLGWSGFGTACEGDDGPSGSGSGSGSDEGSGSPSDSRTATSGGPGSASASGTSAGDVICEVLDPLTGASPGTMADPMVQRTVEGANGVFTDECDDAGNLIDYVCETVSECGPGPNPDCPISQTGNVAPEPFDCAGSCDSGTCVARCPEAGDTVEYTAISGDSASFANNTDGRAYDCMLLFDQMDDTYDCLSDPEVGTTTLIFGLGLMSTWCTGTQSFNIATGDPQQCSYGCTMLPV